MNDLQTLPLNIDFPTFILNEVIHQANDLIAYLRRHDRDFDADYPQLKSFPDWDRAITEIIESYGFQVAVANTNADLGYWGLTHDVIDYAACEKKIEKLGYNVVLFEDKWHVADNLGSMKVSDCLSKNQAIEFFYLDTSRQAEMIREWYYAPTHETKGDLVRYFFYYYPLDNQAATFQYENLDTYYSRSICSHWIVSDWLYLALQQQNEPVADIHGLKIWGRSTTEPNLHDDPMLLSIYSSHLGQGV